MKRAARSLIVGVGNVAYPQSRQSVGVLALNGVRKQLGVYWDQEPKRADVLARMIHVDNVKGDATGGGGVDVLRSGSHAGTVLIEPTTFIPIQIGEMLKAVVEEEGVPTSALTVLHYDNELPLGSVHAGMGGRTRHNHYLSGIYDALRTEVFRRVRVGVGRADPDEAYRPIGTDMYMATSTADTYKGPQSGDGLTDVDKYEQFYLLNPFSDDEMERLTARILPKVAELALEGAGSTSDTTVYVP